MRRKEKQAWLKAPVLVPGSTGPCLETGTEESVHLLRAKKMGLDRGTECAQHRDGTSGERGMRADVGSHSSGQHTPASSTFHRVCVGL